ncbi:unnamed protein product [Clavelina lepadiformis]|uniref:Ubiquitin-like-conjugating enzyme ATG10 n=1 Tax=Clavelina lepadiformis TaxID=159417 RepID=A0ABP0FH19_CLALP
MATISEVEFGKCCRGLYKASNELQDGWDLIEPSESVYLSKKFIKAAPGSMQANYQIIAEVTTIECHVVYSPSYSCPVLYFTASNSEGKRLSLEDCQKLISPVYQEHLTSDFKWSFVTMQEHPVLLKPFYQLHPCHTTDFMKPLIELRNAKCVRNYVFSWLSVVLPVLGLNFRTEEYLVHFGESRRDGECDTLS